MKTFGELLEEELESRNRGAIEVHYIHRSIPGLGELSARVVYERVTDKEV